MTISNSVSLKSLTSIFGTPQYTAPEVWEDKVGKASDIYALGVVLYEMITGFTPFTGSPAALMKQHLNDPTPPIKARYPRLKYPVELDRIIAKAMAKEPTQRFKKATDLYLAFKDVLTSNSDVFQHNKNVQPNQVGTKIINTDLSKSITTKLNNNADPMFIRLSNQFYEAEGKKDFEKIIEVGESILTLFQKNKAFRPKVSIGYLERGLKYLENRVFEKALSDFKRSKSLDPTNPKIYFNMGKCYFFKDNSNRAITEFNVAINLDQDMAEAYSWRATSYEDLGEETKALADYIKFTQLEPGYFSYIELATYYRKKGYYKSAIEIYSKALYLNLTYPDKYNLGIRYDIAECYKEIGDKSFANKEFELIAVDIFTREKRDRITDYDHRIRGKLLSDNKTGEGTSIRIAY